MNPISLRNRLTQFILDSPEAKAKKGRVLICVGLKWYEAGRTYVNKDTGEVFIDVGTGVKFDHPQT